VGSARSPERTRLWLAALLAVGLALRLWGLGYGLPHPWARPDEEAVVVRLLTFDGGDPNPHWFVYPTLSLYLTFAWVKGMFLGGHLTGVWVGPTELAALAKADHRALYLSARLLSALAGVVTIAATYRLGRLLGGRGAGLAGACLLTVSFLHVRESHFFKPDAILALFVTVALIACVGLQRRGTLGAAAIAGVACGLTLSVKYMVTLAVPLVLAACLVPGGRGRPSRLVLLVVAGVTALAAAVAGSPYSLLAWSEFASGMRYIDFWLRYGGEGMGTAFRYHLTHSFLAAQGLPLSLFALGALAWAFRHRALVPVAAFLVASLVQIGAVSAAYTRYLTPFLPGLYAVAGAALVALLGRIADRRVRLAVAGLLVAVLSARPLHSAIRFDQIATARDTRLLARDWFLEKVPTGTPVLVLGSDWPFTFGDPDLSGYVIRRNPKLDPALGIRYVVTQEHPLPFSRLPPAFETLRPALQPVEEFSPFAGIEVPPDARFEARDAFYVPLAGFAGVERGGPLIRVYRVVEDGGADAAS
jgi:hypothetical protein